jgi:hypothetical protein
MAGGKGAKAGTQAAAPADPAAAAKTAAATDAQSAPKPVMNAEDLAKTPVTLGVVLAIFAVGVTVAGVLGGLILSGQSDVRRLEVTMAETKMEIGHLKEELKTNGDALVRRLDEYDRERRALATARSAAPVAAPPTVILQVNPPPLPTGSATAP